MVTPTSEHIVSSYEEELTHITRLIAEMGGMVEDAVTSAVDALGRVDSEMASKVAKGDVLIDKKQRVIDELAVSMIARRQPMAGDLRRIIANIHVATDLERIGDMAKGIGKRTMTITDHRPAQQLFSGVKHMSELVMEQIGLALQCVANPDAEEAVRICKRDEEIDALYQSVFRELLTYMMEDPRTISDCMSLLFCAKNLERAGDHATNIAEAAYYVKTGRNLAEEMEAKKAQA